MTPLSIDLTREQVVAKLQSLGLDWGDEEDAAALVDLLSERYTATDAWSWLLWMNTDLDMRSPISVLTDGRSREVFALARRVVAGS